MSLDIDFPPELTCRPLALVGFTGLNIELNPIHRLIWDAFASTARSERPPLTFINIGNNVSFPRAKPDRTSYDWFVPKGILKRKWISKHLYIIPGVVVLFYDLEWDDPSWKAKHGEIAEKLQVLRSALVGRGTKVVLVLLQNSAPLPSGEDVLAAERAAALCQTCDLAPKALFVLPCRSEHLQGYTLRLESAFYELCQSSYHQCSRAVRSHRDLLNRTNHGYLFVRHQFKMGFYNELKQDVAMANKHYSQAYAHLLELRITDANVTEVKIIAGYIGYKVWKLSFLLNLPREAIAHFRSHLDFFRLRIGHPLTKFEHEAWLSSQFSTFAGLFEEAIELGLPAIQTQHPGFYYQLAATHALNRKKACYQDYSSLNITDLLQTEKIDYSKLEFYGQRPWRPSRLSLEPSEMNAEIDGVAALLVYEHDHFDHTGYIVGALSNAVNQFKNYRSPRMRQHLLVQMAEEYYRSGCYGEALTLLEPLLWEYRKDFWWIPLTSLLRLGLSCSYLSGRLSEYLAIAFELCSPRTVNGIDDKKRLFTQLTELLHGRIPAADSDIDASALEAALALWKTEIQKNITNNPCITTIVTNTVSSFVEIKAAFSRSQFTAETPIELKVHIRYTGPEKIAFSALNVALSNSVYSPFCHLKDVEQLTFESNEVKVFTFKFAAEPQDIGRELQISSVTIQWGYQFTVYLRCEGASSEDFIPCSRTEFPSYKKLHFIEDIVVQNTAEILPRTANVEFVLEHEPPILFGEFYPIGIKLINKEKNNIFNVEILLSVEGGRIYNDPIMNANHDSVWKCSHDTINVSESCDILVYLRTEQIGTQNILVQVNYEIESCVCNNLYTYKSEYTKKITIETIQGIQCEAEFQTLQFQPLTEIPIEEQFVTVVNVTNLSPFPISLDDSLWHLDPSCICQSAPYQLSGLALNSEEKGNDIIIGYISTCDSDKIKPGTYTFRWKRSISKVTDMDLPSSQYSYTLPEMSTFSVPLQLEFDLPAHGYVREPLLASVTLKNISNHIVELDIFMESNDAFMFAGYKQVKARIYPADRYELIYNLYPLLSGFVALPPLSLKCTNGNLLGKKLNQSILNDLIARHLPTHIYVLPQAKEKRMVPTAKA